jgi:hypothetical protein
MLAISTGIVIAGEGPVKEECPGDQAAEQGLNPFGTFHEVIAPAWHQAWPDKDYDALIAAGPKFEKAFKGIAALKPEFTSTGRQKYFENCRKQFGEIVAAYAQAARDGDKDKVYELLPALHSGFEKTAAATMKIEYKQLDGIAVTIGLIVNKHLPENNQNGINGSTETLVTKVDALGEETLPDALTWDKEAVMTDLAGLKTIAGEMKKCCDSNDMDTYKARAEEFDKRLKAFYETYL